MKSSRGKRESSSKAHKGGSNYPYTVTAMKNVGSQEFVEVITGLCEDLFYRKADSLEFKPTVWLFDHDKPSLERYFFDDEGNKHHMREFEKIGDGDPYKRVHLLLAQSLMYDLEDQVKKTAKSQMLSGYPVLHSYEAAYEYWTSW